MIASSIKAANILYVSILAPLNTIFVMASQRPRLDILSIGDIIFGEKSKEALCKLNGCEISGNSLRSKNYIAATLSEEAEIQKLVYL